MFKGLVALDAMSLLWFNRLQCYRILGYLFEIPTGVVTFGRLDTESQALGFTAIINPDLGTAKEDR